MARMRGGQPGRENGNWRGGDWCDHKREKFQVHNAKAAARKRGVESTLTLGEWLEILDRYEHKCAYCFGPAQELDHAVELIDGGTNTADNVVPACMPCNRRKYNGAGWVPHIASEFWPSLPEKLYGKRRNK